MVPLPSSKTKALLSPEPKRLYSHFLFPESPELSRSQSCDLLEDSCISELSQILNQGEMPTIGKDLFSTGLFSTYLNRRENKNPIVSDEEFRMIESALSTAEDSDSDHDRVFQSF
jgi:hypothetical protein